MRILLVDDHTLFVEGLRVFLESEHINVVGTAADGLEAVEQARRCSPDVVLMDIGMPRSSGIEATRQIKAELPHIKVVMLTMSAQDSDLFEAIKHGAAGYITKDIQPRSFLDLLLGVTRGEAAITREMATRIMGEFVRTEKKGADTAPSNGHTKGVKGINELSPRQTDILRYVSEGYTYKEIATALTISERTVNYHMAEILSKLQLQNRAQVIAFATRHGLIEKAKNSDPKPRQD
jgi:two-component system NarL family response regulator